MNRDPLATSADWQDIGEQVQIEARMGSLGGMSEIYQGYWTRPEAQPIKVAIKVIRFSGASPQKTRRRLHRELSVWSSLRDRHVLPLCGITRNMGDYPAMVSPWCENGNISSYLRQRKTDSTIARLRQTALQEIALGVHYLHEHDVVHGDLKTANILVSRDGKALLADFGLASVLADGTTLQSFTSVVKGTCRWMAPELFLADETRHTKASDIWAFGCVILELMTGGPPFPDKQNDQKVILALARGERPLDLTKRPDSFSEVTWSCMAHCWELPTQRPRAGSLVRMLRHPHCAPAWWTSPPPWIRRVAGKDNPVLSSKYLDGSYTAEREFADTHRSVLLRWCLLPAIGSLWIPLSIMVFTLQTGTDDDETRQRRSLAFASLFAISLTVIVANVLFIPIYGTPLCYATYAAGHGGHYPRWFCFVPLVVWLSPLSACACIIYSGMVYGWVIGLLVSGSWAGVYALLALLSWCISFLRRIWRRPTVPSQSNDVSDPLP